MNLQQTKSESKISINSKYEYKFCLLSDELVANTKMKLESKARDLFKGCVDQVKEFLSGEPYNEFRN